MTDVEGLTARLNVCRQQLESNTVINTAKRKEALREEIKQLENQIATALGIEDDADDDDDDGKHLPANKTNVKNENERNGGSISPESEHLPPISSPGRTRSPSPLEQATKKLKLESANTSFDLSPSSSVSGFDTLDSTFSHSYSGSGSASGSSTDKNAAESVILALKDAGEDDMDLEALLKQQAEMEQRWADMKRKREEDDEVFARSIQEEEIQTFNKNTNFASPGSGPGSSPGKLLMQSKLDKARQEREDEEMARLFEMSDASSYSLSTSPKKQSAQSLDSNGLPRPSQPVFSIFDKRPAAGGSSSSSSAASSSTTPSAPLTATQTAAIGILSDQNRARAQVPQSTGSTAGSTNTAIDLTRPTIDLTKQVHEIHSDDETPYKNVQWTLASALARTFNAFSNYNTQHFNAQSSSNSWGSYGNIYDLSDDDEDEDEYDYDGWASNQSAAWDRYPSSYSSYSSSYDYSRSVTQEQSEKELRELLANIQAAEEEIAPQDRTGTPEGMADHIALLEHQKIGLTWLQKMEDGTNRGGILADDMGLGKTIQTMALIVSRPRDSIDDSVIWDRSTVYYHPPAEKMLVQTKATLVIAPVALMYQWKEELTSKTQPGLLKIHIYHGSAKFSDPEMLRRYDVIITTATTLSGEMGVKEGAPSKHKPIGTLFKANFHRIVIDEAHVIKNKTTKASKACALLSATYRWCLTGTPVQNNVDELFSLMRFLHIKPYCEWEEFRDKISSPMKKMKGYGNAMQRVQALLKAVCLRRTKTSTVDGKPILQLPERNVQKVETPFSADERAFYEALETRTRERFNAYVKAGTVMKNYSNILVLLLRLRQACCHPHLIKDFDKATEVDAPEDKRAHVDTLLDNLLEDIRRRLLERGMEAVECPICMDVGEESVILSGCGHIYCRACITAYLQQHEEAGKCPECRGKTRVEDLIPVADFNERFNPAPIAEAALDPKGKGKAVDNGDGDFDDGKLPTMDVAVPEELDEWISSSKIDRMIDVVQDVIRKREKVIVFSQFTSLLSLIEKPLQSQGIKYLKYDGSMSPQARNEAVHKMTNDPRFSVMLISLKCGSLGLNMTVANHVVMMDPWWNPALENQAIDRVHRIGQTRNVHVHRLCIPDTVEDRILILQEKKQALADGALGEGTVPKLAKLGLQELVYLFSRG